MSLESFQLYCPYCGEEVEIDVEPMDEDQELIEDCRVCCRPIQFDVTAGPDGLEVTAKRSD